MGLQIRCWPWVICGLAVRCVVHYVVQHVVMYTKITANQTTCSSS